MNAWVGELLQRVVDADLGDRQARAAAKAAELGMLVIYDDIPEYDAETLERGRRVLEELAPEIVRILEQDRTTGL